MILGGDETSQTRGGNNNTYCQDNEISWARWDLDDEQRSFLKFTRSVIQLRRKHPVFRRRSFFRGRSMRDPNLRDLAWFRPDGKEMTAHDWNDPSVRCLGMILTGDAINEFDERGNSIIDDTMLVLINAHWEPISFVMPLSRIEKKWGLYKGSWILELDTGSTTERDLKPLKPGRKYKIKSRSVAVFRFRDGGKATTEVERLI